MPPTPTPRHDLLERVFDLRDRFPQPLETFRQALECLQTDNAYFPDMSSEIVAYLRGAAHCLSQNIFLSDMLAIAQLSYPCQRTTKPARPSTRG